MANLGAEKFYDLLKNLGYWYIGQLIGLNYTHANQGFLKDFSYSFEKMRNWGLKLWFVGIATIVYIVSVIYFVANCFITIGQGLF